MTPLPCPKCGRVPEFDYLYVVTIFCGHCYEWSPETKGTMLVAHGRTREAAIGDWNAWVEEYEP